MPSGKGAGAAREISDEAVLKKTGKRWDEWFDLLDAASAHKLTHPEIVRWLRDEHQPGLWWEQAITGAYERARGLRDKHEMPDGFQASKSKTIAASAEEVFDAWARDEVRGMWLDGAGDITIRKSTRPKSLRITWVDLASDVDVYITQKKPDRTSVVVNHRKLPDGGAAGRMKTFWAEQLANLASMLGGR